MIEAILKELKIAMFLMGASNVDELKNSDLIISGGTREWLSARKIDYKKYANRGIDR
jgi:isopentenyl-diphosphate delta-isomerase